jgi:hypothetical protein
MRRHQVLTLVRGGSVALVIAAIVAQAVVGIQANAFDPTRFFGYFTIQSNLIGVAALLLTMGVRRGRRSRRLELLRGAAAVYLTVTFVVVIVLLSNIDVGLQLPWVDFVLHKLFPVVVVADWVLDPPHHRLALRDGLVWLVYPIVWTAVTMVRGALDGWYPYPFLDPANGGYGTVVVVMLGITVAFFALAAVYIWLGNRLGGPRAELQPAT